MKKYFIFFVLLCGSQALLANTIRLSLQASPNVNVGSKGQQNSVAVTIIQLDALNHFPTADFFALTERPKTTLKGDLLGINQVIVLPGAQKRIGLEADDNTKYIGIVVAYEKYQGKAWRLAIPVSQLESLPRTIKLNAEGASLAPLKISTSAFKASLYTELDVTAGGTLSSDASDYLIQETTDGAYDGQVQSATNNDVAAYQAGVGYQFSRAGGASLVKAIGLVSDDLGLYARYQTSTLSAPVIDAYLEPDFLLGNHFTNTALFLQNTLHFIGLGPISPYLGIDLGYNIIADSIDYYDIETDGNSIYKATAENGQGGGFLYGANAGLDWAIHTHFHLKLGYQYLSLGSITIDTIDKNLAPDFLERPAENPEISLQESEVYLGLQYNF